VDKKCEDDETNAGSLDLDLPSVCQMPMVDPRVERCQEQTDSLEAL
jgi:hypothetical protein